MDLLTMLPLLSGWRLIRVSNSEELKAGTTSEIYESEDDERLWFLGAYFHTNVADSGMKATIYTAGGQMVTYDLTPKTLYDAGFIEPNDVSPYVGAYDTSGSLFVAVFQPKVPVPIQGRLTITLVGGSSDATVSYDARVVDVVDPSAFYESIKEVLGIKDIESLLAKPAPTPVAPPFPEVEYTGFIP